MRTPLPHSIAFLATLFSITMGMGAAAQLSQPALAEADERSQPNIIYILADDLGYGDLGSYGQDKIQTPRLDRMAEEGMRFTRHYAGAPVCAPSRCVLMTGLHTSHAPIRGNGEVKPEGQRPIPTDFVTVGNLLQDAGYHTACIGKWGLGGPGSVGEPNERGFDHWFGYLCQRQAHNYYPGHLWRDGQRVELKENEGGQEGGHLLA